MSFFGYAIAPNADHLCHFYSTSTSIFTFALVSVFMLLLFIIALNLEKSGGEPLFITVSVSSLEWIGYFVGSKKNSLCEFEPIQPTYLNPERIANIALARRSNLRCG